MMEKISFIVPAAFNRRNHFGSNMAKIDHIGQLKSLLKCL